MGCKPLPVRLTLGKTDRVLAPQVAERILGQVARMRGMLSSEGFGLTTDPAVPAVFTLNVFGISDEPFSAPLLSAASLAQQRALLDDCVETLTLADEATQAGWQIDGQPAFNVALRSLGGVTRSATETLNSVCRYHPGFAQSAFRTQLYLPYAQSLAKKLQQDAGYAGAVARLWKQPNGHRQATIGAIQALGAGIVQVSESVLPKIEGLRIARVLLDYLGRSPDRMALEGWLASAAQIAGVETSSLPGPIVDFGDVLPLQLPRLPFALAPFSGEGITVEEWDAPFRFVSGDSEEAEIGRLGVWGPYCITATPYIGRYLGQILSGVIPAMD